MSHAWDDTTAPKLVLSIVAFAVATTAFSARESECDNLAKGQCSKVPGGCSRDERRARAMPPGAGGGCACRNAILPDAACPEISSRSCDREAQLVRRPLEVFRCSGCRRAHCLAARTRGRVPIDPLHFEAPGRFFPCTPMPLRFGREGTRSLWRFGPSSSPGRKTTIHARSFRVSAGAPAAEAASRGLMPAHRGRCD
jgi:hypothetical protein